MRAPERAISFPSGGLPESTVELLARELHAVFSEGREARSYEDLTELQRAQNRASVRDIPAKLRTISCRLISAAEDEAFPFAFTEAELEALARREHERWAALAAVMSTGADAERPASQLLVPWDDLSDAERQKDRDVVAAIPRIAARVGLSVVRLEASSPPGRAPCEEGGIGNGC